MSVHACCEFAPVAVEIISGTRQIEAEPSLPSWNHQMPWIHCDCMRCPPPFYHSLTQITEVRVLASGIQKLRKQHFFFRIQHPKR